MGNDASGREDEEANNGNETAAESSNPSQVEDNSKQRQLDEVRENAEGERLTTDHGVPIEDTDDSLKGGERGPTLMDDFHFREKMTQFDHERMPERVVHARGTGAHGYFQPYEDPDLGQYSDISELTKAGFLQDPNQQTPVFVRFSTVVGFRGSADTVRDVRGFATKFYTEEGNFDLVGNNMPVFFIQDAIKFPDLVHAIKPEPDDHIPQASAAHDTFWDFASLTPESTHMLLWVLSDRALPRAYRMMEGFGVHSFRFVNDEGTSRFVKFHWKPRFGLQQLVWDETQKIAGKNPDFNRESLYETIENGVYPEWELGVQVVEEDEAERFDFDILDPTKIIPEENVPVRRLGKMVLNETPDNFFAEVEQAAFHPGNLVPGIDVSNDPLLQGRMFSYQDTQLNRFGSANWAEVPINRSLAERHNNQRDGFMRHEINEGRTAYSPNSLEDDYPRETPEAEGGYVHYPEQIEGRKIRERPDAFDDHFSQARLFWNSLSDAEQDHIVSATHFELGKLEHQEVKERVVYELLNNVDHDLAVRAAEGIGITPPVDPGNHLPDHDDESPALSMEHAQLETIESRKVAILAADGVDVNHLNSVVEALDARDASFEIVSGSLGTLTGDDGSEVAVDANHPITGSIMYDAVFVPGGEESVAALKGTGEPTHFLAEAVKHKKPVGATGAGTELFGTIDLPEAYVSEDKLSSNAGIVSAPSPDTLDEFVSEFIEAIEQHRHWERDVEDVPA